MDRKLKQSGYLSIGALARATGLAATTLRNWERRYGFPEPERLGSGHRRYSPAVLTRLHLVVRALGAGLRPAAVVPLGEEELRALLGQTSPTLGRVGLDGELSVWLDAVMRVDAEALERGFRQAWTRHGARGFVFELAVPFMHEVGEQWSRADLVVMHEHFASELLRGFLGLQLNSLNIMASGPCVVCATLSGELHSLGLQMAAVLLAAANFKVLYLGASTPSDQIAQAATHGDAAAVLIGSSSAADGSAVCAELDALRDLLPPAVELAAGGNEAVPCAGVAHLASLSDCAGWGESLARVRARGL